MASIKVTPKVVEEKRKLSMSLPASLVDRLDLYAKYLGGATDRYYVIEQVLAQFLEQDRGFQRWLEENGHAAASDQRG
jgi:hypothetical protein